ncbi:M56 family metallopeptidase [Robertkochia flava]|uniref:M56 family metallopeptidase n=1 Tax=Robertkochia flava TaxID=3447986 RepID=UPI001CCC1655|nr:M56 family metallopeptidase [Robertkochia marina]
MIRYLIIMLTCQVVFLLVYDQFLKKETFFNWNRIYLLLTPLVSLLVPFIKLEALKTTAPEPLSNAFPVIFLEPTPAVVEAAAVSSGWELTPWQWVALSGSLVAMLFFIYKLGLLFRLRYHATIRRFREYLQVEVEQGEMAFSFFRQIFLGRKVLERKHDHIIEHELVHIREGHTWDLMYFELLRILFWFNPLVYVYQARITELHEYIADAQMAGSHKKETYQYLLEEVFQTQKISFINSFFNHSLIKKRIVMLHQNRSKTIRKFKYLLMLPLLLGMLIYTSCEQEVNNQEGSELVIENPQLQKYYNMYKDEIHTQQELKMKLSEIYQESKKEGVLSEEQFYRQAALFLINEKMFQDDMGLTDPDNNISSQYLNASYEEYLKTSGKTGEKSVGTPFTEIPVKPSFKTPCEDGQEAFKCFTAKLNQHVIENFSYPEDARMNGYEGTAYVLMKIDVQGVVHVEHVKSSHESLAAEARRIIESLPVLNPGGDEDGNPVPVTLAYPIVFKLAGDSIENVDTQKSSSIKDVPFLEIPVKPSFKSPCADGQEAFECFKEKLNAHVMENFSYPEEARRQGIQGRVYINFRINEDGSVQVINSRAPHSLLDQEARRIIESLPDFNPGGDLDGNPVPVTFAYPIVFQLD